MENQATRVIVSFFLSLVIIYGTARLVGEENKANWFKKREQKGIFNRRGFLGDTWNFGYPRTREGLLVFIVMFSIIGVIGYSLIFLW